MAVGAVGAFDDPAALHFEASDARCSPQNLLSVAWLEEPTSSCSSDDFREDSEGGGSSLPGGMRSVAWRWRVFFLVFFAVFFLGRVLGARVFFGLRFTTAADGAAERQETRRRTINGADALLLAQAGRRTGARSEEPSRHIVLPL